MFISKRAITSIGFMILFFAGTANSTCIIQNGGIPGTQVSIGSKVDVSIYGLQFQPAGTRIAFDSITSTQMASLMGAPPDRVVFKCDIADASSIFEIYYLPKTYIFDNAAPAFTYDNIKYWGTNIQGMAFELFLGMNRDASYQFDNVVNAKPMAYDIDPDNPQKINIKLKHFSGLSIEQVRSQQNVSGNSLGTVGVVNRGVVGFKGPGINNTINNNYEPAGYTFFKIRQRPVGGRQVTTCGLKSSTSTVYLGSHSSNDIPSTPTPFSFTLECQKGAKISYGFAPGEENRAMNEVDYLLLDPNLGSTAKGVAIEILNSSGQRNKLLRLGAIDSPIPTANNWTSVSVPTTGAATHELLLNFTARYVRYGNEPIKPGKANSKMTITLNTN
ncbi:TPA: fimbrial protein [Providencia stuartii]|uniref:fimbrial protein n=1 Tax=Providencia TaxID=586 RepID=UPI00097722FF|nr:MULTISPECIES: fimbrial protein [Providencia]OMH51981.1 hypothetical protein BTZ17_10045 [Providencia stuartii]HEM8863823.1 fimbrial protein [Providencia stuartii]